MWQRTGRRSGHGTSETTDRPPPEWRAEMTAVPGQTVASGESGVAQWQRSKPNFYPRQYRKIDALINTVGELVITQAMRVSAATV